MIENKIISCGCSLREVSTFHGTDLYIEVSFPGLKFSHLVPSNEEERVREEFDLSGIQTMGELDEKFEKYGRDKNGNKIPAIN